LSHSPALLVLGIFEIGLVNYLSEAGDLIPLISAS
jgi:hypothetical protein